LQKDYEHPAGEYWVPARLGGSAPTLEEADRMDASDAEAKAAARQARRQNS
ncbi:MAG: 1-acyl-sn-glycerol-3-phosphate acyltransferase, partial [Rhodococcus sp.]|nr:1-acyl-sn-glycerol-3-phosphate acyltransferase [Rhodococcus sp. (in: high G+C Gram-positive bacteria)]